MTTDTIPQAVESLKRTHQRSMLNARLKEAQDLYERAKRLHGANPFAPEHPSLEYYGRKVRQAEKNLSEFDQLQLL